MKGRDIYLEILRVQTDILLLQKNYAEVESEELKNMYSKEISKSYIEMADLMNIEYDLKL